MSVCEYFNTIFPFVQNKHILTELMFYDYDELVPLPGHFVSPEHSYVIAEKEHPP
jgi:hypothetical protein